MCKFPFIHNGKKYDSCTKDPTPAAINPLCVKFEKWAKKAGVQMNFEQDKNLPQNGPVKVEDPFKRGYFVHCFTAEPGNKWSQRSSFNLHFCDSNFLSQGPNGWCGACYHDTSAE